MQEERGRRCATRGAGKKGLCGKVCLELYELQSQQSGGAALAITRLWSGPLRSAHTDRARTLLFKFEGRLSPNGPPRPVGYGLTEEALSAVVNIGTRPTSQGGRERLRLANNWEPEFCCSVCESGWAFEEPKILLDIRKVPQVALVRSS